MSTGPRILVTNDDGVDAPGLKIMLTIARALSDDVTVVAPARNQSGAGHRFTLGTEMSYKRVEHDIYALDGSPADCVVLGITHLLKNRRPDIVLSGVNHGQNLGDIIHCSGTLAGAREGALHGALGIALSQALDYEAGQSVNWDAAENWGVEVVKKLVDTAAGTRGGTYYNVNFPIGPASDVSGVQVVPHQRFSRSPFAYYGSRNEGKFFVAIPETPQPISPGHDFHVLHHDHAITVTPLRLELTDHESLDVLHSAFRSENETTP